MSKRRPNRLQATTEVAEREQSSFTLVSDDVAPLDKMNSPDGSTPLHQRSLIAAASESALQPVGAAEDDVTQSNNLPRSDEPSTEKKRHYGRPRFWSRKALFHLFSPSIMVFGGAIVALFVVIFVCTCLVMANPNNKCDGIYDAFNRVMRGAHVVQRNVTDFALLFPIYLLGEHERQIGHIPQAIKAYELIQRLNPEYNYGSIITDQANCYATLGDSQKALASFDRAILMNPKSPRPYYARVHLYQLQKNYPAALSDYTTAIKLGAYRAYFRRLEVSTALHLDDLVAQDRDQIARYGLEDVPGTASKLIGLPTRTPRK